MTVLGIFNEEVVGIGSDTSSANPIFIVGSGNSDRRHSNALVVQKSGNVGLGTDEPMALLHQSHNSTNQNPQLRLTEEGADLARVILENDQNENFWVVAGKPDSNATISQINFFYDDNTQVGGNNTGNKFRIFGDGDAWLKGTLTQASDITLKKNINKIIEPLSVLQAINGYTYNWKSDVELSKKQYGVIAQEVQNVIPDIVHTDQDGNLSVAYSSLIPVLIESVKEQQKMITEQQNTIKKLSLRILRLEEK